MFPARALAILGIQVMAAAGPAATAMTVTPTHLELVSAGSQSRARITVVNNSAQPLPIESIVLRANLDEAGLPTTSKAGDEFLIMPPQALIAPGATQNFRIQWLGEPMIESSQSFLIYMTQVAVKLPPNKSAVQVVMSVGVMVNVAPPRGVASLQILQTDVTTDRAGKRQPTITVFNPSRIHALLPQATIRLASGSWSETITPGILNERIGIGLVQPGRKRRFILPVALPAGVHTVQARLDFTPKR